MLSTVRKMAERAKKNQISILDAQKDLTQMIRLHQPILFNC